MNTPQNYLYFRKQKPLVFRLTEGSHISENITFTSKLKKSAPEKNCYISGNFLTKKNSIKLFKNFWAHV